MMTLTLFTFLQQQVTQPYVQPAGTISIAQFVLQLATGLGSAAIVGFLFWAWLTSQLNFIKQENKENRARIISLEKQCATLISKDDHSDLRKEDKEMIEKQIAELKQDIKDMPGKILSTIKNFLKE